MYKKFASIFLMVSLSLFIFNFSFAVEEIYLDIFEDLGFSAIKQSDFSDVGYQNNFISLSENLSEYPYYFIQKTSSGDIRIYFFEDIPCLHENEDYRGQYEFYPFDVSTMSTNSFFEYYKFKSSGNSYLKVHNGRTRTRLTSAVSCYTNIPDCNTRDFDIVKTVDGNVVLSGNVMIHPLSTKINVIDDSYAGLSPLPSMQNPLTNEEILSLVNELLLSEAAVHRPKDYNKLFIQYDTDIEAYFAFFYPDDATVKGGIRPADQSDFEYDTYVLYGNQTVGFWESFFDASKTPVNFNYYVCSKGTPLNPNTWGFYENKNNQQVSITYYSCLTRPIVYTTHDLGFMLWNLDESGNPVEDEVNSIPSTEVTDANGNKVDFVFPEVVDDDPNVLMFVGTFLRVILAIFNVLVRFIAFITTLMAIPADSSLLLPEFVQGIDWIKALDINGISIFAFFQISIIIAFGIGVVKFIKEAFAE